VVGSDVCSTADEHWTLSNVCQLLKFVIHTTLN
jgi:hypothetical protein